MSKVLVIIYLLLSFCSEAATATVYVSTTGNDATGNGSIENPYATVAKAVGVALTGDTVFIKNGIYNLPDALYPKVSIVGESKENVILSSTYTDNNANMGAFTYLASANGQVANVVIKNLTMEGNLTARGAIVTRGYSNITIENLIIRNFRAYGVFFNGGIINGQKPVPLATGLVLKDCFLLNNSDRYEGAPAANLIWSGTKGLVITNNIIDQRQRAPNHNGNIATGNNGSIFNAWNEGLQYTYNKSYKNKNDGSEMWSFHLEMWDMQGGCEFAWNEFHGGYQMIDVAGVTGKVKGDYDYSFWIHHNKFIQDTIWDATFPFQPVGVNLEGRTQDAIVEDNYFQNVPFGIYLNGNQIDVGPPTLERIYIRRNLLVNGGFTNGDFCFDILFTPGSGCTYRDIFIDNNTIKTRSNGGFFMYLNSADKAINIRYRNNIVMGVPKWGWAVMGGSGSRDSIYFQNNLRYNNFSNNVYYYDGATTPTNFVYQGNLTGDPLFNADFTLKPGSPALSSGIGVESSFSGSAQNIGAFPHN